MNLQNDDEVPVPAKQRTILWYLVFIGFSVNYMQRCNLNIAIIDMVAKTQFKLTSTPNVSSECLESTSFNESIDIQTNFSRERQQFYSFERHLLNLLSIDYEPDGFNWDERVQGQVLGSFFYFHFLLQLSGGIWAAKYGTKLIFGMANLIGCFLCTLMPLASYLDYKYLMFLRILQGIVCSMAWPSMHVMSGKWIPKFERARFVSAYLGSSFGVAIFYPFFGYIMKVTSWEYVFHFSALIGFIWWICWQYFVYDTPGEHPRIHPLERNHIEESLSSTLILNEENSNNKTPWKEILTSRALWINTIAQFGGIFGLYTILTQAPTYFKIIHGWQSTKVGILSGAPHLLRAFMAILISHFADYLLRNEILSRNAVRKMGAAMATVVNGIFVLCVAYSGCNSTLACIFIIIATGCHGAVSSGPLAAIIDISPKYAGILLAIVNIFCTLPGYISPIIVSYLTYQNQTTESWKTVFIITGLLLISSGIVYIVFADSSQQKWSNGKIDKKLSNGNIEEMRVLSENVNKNEHESNSFNERKTLNS